MKVWRQGFRLGADETGRRAGVWQRSQPIFAATLCCRWYAQHLQWL